MKLKGKKDNTRKNVIYSKQGSKTGGVILKEVIKQRPKGRVQKDKVNN